MIPFPSCLKYAEIGLKMMKKFNININNVKQRLLNEQQVIERLDFITSFYLIIPLNYGKKKRNKNKIELV